MARLLNQTTRCAEDRLFAKHSNPVYFEPEPFGPEPPEIDFGATSEAGLLVPDAPLDSEPTNFNEAELMQ